MNKVKRLYIQFQPKTYKLQLSIDETAMTFAGHAVINGKKIGRPSKRITFHQKALNITSATITHHDKTGHVIKEIARINKHNSFEEVRLHTQQTLYSGNYEIELEFSGVITKAMNGIYPCKYEENGVKKQLIATQFESHYAREVFPCIDEPEAKAVFSLNLDTRETVVISNTPVATKVLEDGRQKTEFEPTPLMSTYLLAFVIGDMAYKEAHSQRGVIVRSYSTPSNIKLTDFALKTALRCIDFYEKYFGIEYPLAKCDLIALPDFASGAMENWGCITFREQCMLVDPSNTSIPTKQFVAMVVAHELAHMWFGNLVTMRWWTDLWLNEGFATWIEYLAIDTLFPKWQIWTQFISDEQQQAMKLDSLYNTHPIEVAVHHPEEIHTIFDTISYSKGASVIHQLHAYIGADVFQKGLQIYLTKHAFKNSDTADLWQALSEASGKDIKKFMHVWTSVPGYPIVHVSKNLDNKITLSQKRFFLTEPSKTFHQHNWNIPLLYNQSEESMVLESKNMEFVLTSKQPLLLNSQRSGFYRVSYEETLLEQIALQIDKQKLSPLDRLGILADLLEASKSGDTATVSTLKFMSHYKREDNAVVWITIANIIGSIRLVYNDDELRDNMKPFIIDLALPEYARLGWHKKSTDSYFDQLLRPIILGLLASADYKEVVDICHKLFNAATKTHDIDPQLRTAASATQVKRNIDIDPDARGVVFSTVARLGDNDTFDKLITLYDQTTLSEEKLVYAAALTDFKQSECIKRALDLIKSDKVRSQDVSYWIAYSFLNHHARKMTWDWLQKNWDWLQKNIGTDLSFYRIPLYIARVHSDSKFTKEYIEFFTSRMSPGLERSYKQGLEMMQWQNVWRKRDFAPVLDYFTGLTQNTTSPKDSPNV